jgi:hypothetical protein
VALEDRVKQLEDEVKVLKNEIQTMLLDIQEQVLSHYYPTLYPSLNSEVSSRPKAPTPAPEHQVQPEPPVNSIHARYKTKTITLVEDIEEDEGEHDRESEKPIEPAPRKATSVSKPQQTSKPPSHNGNGKEAKSSEPLEEETAAPDSNPPNKNTAFLDRKMAEEYDKFLDVLLEAEAYEEIDEKISFDEFSKLFPKKGETQEVDANPLTGEMLDELFDSTFPFIKENSGNQTSAPQNPLNSQAVKLTVRKLLSWVDESVALIGKERTKQAVDLYVRAGDLSPEMHHTLLQLVDSSRQPPAQEPTNIKTIINTLSKLNEILDLHTPEYLAGVLNFIKVVNFG